MPLTDWVLNMLQDPMNSTRKMENQKTIQMRKHSFKKLIFSGWIVKCKESGKSFRPNTFNNTDYCPFCGEDARSELIKNKFKIEVKEEIAQKTLN